MVPQGHDDVTLSRHIVSDDVALSNPQIYRAVFIAQVTLSTALSYGIQYDPCVKQRVVLARVPSLLIVLHRLDMSASVFFVFVIFVRFP